VPPVGGTYKYLVMVFFATMCAFKTPFRVVESFQTPVGGWCGDVIRRDTGSTRYYGAPVVAINQFGCCSFHCLLVTMVVASCDVTMCDVMDICVMLQAGSFCFQGGVPSGHV